MTKQKKIFFYCIFFIVLASLPALALEVFLRASFPQPLGPVMFEFDSVFGQIPKRNQKAHRTLSEDPAYMATNDEKGLRLVPGSKDRDSDLRILLLGDSFTYGIGVNDHETFANLVATTRRAQVINAGNPGTGNDYALKFLRAKAADHAPNVVVVNFFPNDYADNMGGRYFHLAENRSLVEADVAKTFSFYRSKQGLGKIPLYEWFCERSHALSFLRRFAAYLKISGGIGDIEVFLKNRPDLRPFERGFANETNLEMVDIIFRNIQQEARGLGAKLLVTYVPSRFDVERYSRSGVSSDDESAFSRAMKSLGIRFLSFTPALADSKLDISRLYLNEGHWTAESHSLAAAALANAF